MKKVFLGAVLSSALLMSCGTNNKMVNLSGDWNIVTVGETCVKSGSDAFIGFNVKEGRIYGNAGCNSIMGTLKLDSKKSAVSFSEVGSTRKMCPDMNLEHQILSSLGKVSAYKATKAGVALTDADGNVVFELQKKCTGTSCCKSINGEWLISVADGKAVKTVENTPFIVLDTTEHKVYGNGGCNIFNGVFTIDENVKASLRFANLVRTMKSGPGLEQEDAVIAALEKVRSFELKKDVVVLRDENGKVAVVLKKNTGKKLGK